MSAADLRCSLCRNVVDAEDLFCANCGRQTDTAPGAALPTLEPGLAGFDCRGCGASMTYDARAQALRCAFCGSTDLARQPGTTGRVRPTHLLAFTCHRDRAQAAFRTWLASGFWRPRRLAQEARLEGMQAVYVPCWRFAGRTDTHWTADSSETPRGARASWCPRAGRSPGEVEDVLVVASGSLTPREVDGLLPFRFGEAQPYQPEAVGDTPVEDVGVSRRGARPLAGERIVALEAARVAMLVPGRSRNVHVNVLVTDLTSTPVLLPVWINAYRWREQRYRFLVNGQTGEVVGEAPISAAKVVLAVLLGLLVLAGATWLWTHR